MTIKEMITRQARALSEASSSDISDEKMWAHELEWLKEERSHIAGSIEKYADWECKDVGSRATLLMSKIVSAKPNEHAFGGNTECEELIRLCAYIVSVCMYDECIATLVDPIDITLYCSEDDADNHSMTNAARNAYNDEVCKRISAIMYILNLICSGALEDQEFLNDIASVMLGDDDINDPEALADILKYGDDDVQTVVEESDDDSLTIASLGDIAHL